VDVDHRGARDEWLRALDRVGSLESEAVVSRHGVLEPDSSPRHIEETRRYIRDFNACLATRSTPQDLYERMLSLHPNRVNPGSLLGGRKSCQTILSRAQARAGASRRSAMRGPP
jgi:hypothetical protein